jgi:hypothetical protein
MTTEYIWEEIDAFRSAYEFEKFVRWIEKQVQEGVAIEIPFEKYYRDFGAHNILNVTTTEPLSFFGGHPIERWFKNLNGDVWRLVTPDPPFPGCWLIVENES